MNTSCGLKWWKDLALKGFKEGPPEQTEKPRERAGSGVQNNTGMQHPAPRGRD
jgi:hypothetical protein